MAPHGDAITTSTSTKRNNFPLPPKLSKDSLNRTVSNITFLVSKEVLDNYKETATTSEKQLPPISEVEDAKCECCGMSEEYTPEYIERIHNKFLGKWICGLCAEAVKEEMEKNGGKIEQGLSAYMNTCARFNKIGRAYPALLTAEAMREILRKSSRDAKSLRAKSISPRDRSGAQKNGGVARSTSCIPAITRDINNLNVPN
ncbi:hypothetical protein F3Y22_tig00116997pilonHSYRG00740 [Hibiscus syriacus]|uniref:Uncharacterized protein n=1 Tax=Hibiscus syriacus TaxID=106335 RepID=A0A6A2WM10_HIBSY|nr:uncharacterized protein LOC120194398 [Hibiscus syriacus]KAE8656985.1 hypothetical protein F3Y22_tig00116997pilonHSYRG00740 [Hibiscus syriacus]